MQKAEYLENASQHLMEQVQSKEIELLSLQCTLQEYKNSSQTSADPLLLDHDPVDLINTRVPEELPELPGLIPTEYVFKYQRFVKFIDSYLSEVLQQLTYKLWKIKSELWFGICL